MPSILIRNATVLPFTLQSSGSLDLTPQKTDVWIEGDRITQVAPSIEAQTDQVIDATDQLLIPGFVDAHTHTVVGVLEKCAYEALPLELWMLYLPPDQTLDPRMHYLCSAIAALEAVKNGTTTLQDDLYALPYTPPEVFEATAQAYTDLGIRASLSLHAINKPLHQTIPYLDQWLPVEMKEKLTAYVNDFSIGHWSKLFQDLYQNWHGKAGLITTMLAPSATQRVTPELMEKIGELSTQYDVPIHVHLLETRTQAVTGLEFYGESVIQFAKRHGMLTHRTTIAHGIWLTPEDIALVAEAGASIVHNPVSNYRLCSGIASIRALMDAGINIAIGTDGMDSFNLFHGIRTAGLTHSVIDSDYGRYPRSADVLKWATQGGAKSTMLQSDIGAIAPGMKADFVLYDLNSLSFTPCHELPIHLVYAEDGRSIRKVFVNGQLIVADGKVLTLDEADILAEFRERLPHYLKLRPGFHQQAETLRPSMEKMYQKAMAHPLPIENFSAAGLAALKSN
ncbi:MAG: amidohydrolase family protein [Oculatellaceae cyanobacterium Prado106]|jgi:cytosine/adenosine deaminase-related metal-dependent hydrolase|nr:amidohydrolase family protein [Oculatellaceae cyanobacterium Prado106]